MNPQTGRVYVGNNADSTVSVINTADNIVSATVPVAGQPLAIADNPVTNNAYITTSTRPGGYHDGNLVVIDGANTVAGSRSLQQDGDGPHFGDAVNSLTNTVYVTHFYGSSVTAYDGATLTPGPTAYTPAPGIVFGVAVDEATNTLYVNSSDGQSVAVINASTSQVIANIPVAMTGSVAVDSSRHTAYANTGGNAVAVIDTRTNTVVATVPAGQGAAQVAVDPSAGVVYVANTSGNTVSVIDESTNTVIATVAVGSGPVGVAVDPTTHTAYVTNKGSNTVSVIRTIASTPVITNIPAGAVFGGSFTATVNTTGDGTSSVSSSTPGVCTVTGFTVRFVGTRTCTLTAAVTAGKTYGAATGSPQSFAVSKSSQAITFTSTPPSPSVSGGSYTVTATGGGSGNPVTLGTTTPGACTVTGSTVTFTATGTCTVTANQVGNANYTAAPQVTQQVTVTKAATTSTLTSSPAVFGYPVTFTAHVAPSAGNAFHPTGTVSFYLNGSTTPLVTVPLGADGTATTTTSGLPAGSNTVTAVYTGDTNFTTSSSPATPVTVGGVTTTITGDHYGAIFVAAGHTVVLSNATQHWGPVVVQSGGRLDVENSTINGVLVADRSPALRVCGSKIASKVTVTDAYGFVLIGDPADGCAVNTISGSLYVERNHHGVQVIGNHVAGAVRAYDNTGSGPFPANTTATVSGNGP